MRLHKIIKRVVVITAILLLVIQQGCGNNVAENAADYTDDTQNSNTDDEYIPALVINSHDSYVKAAKKFPENGIEVGDIKPVKSDTEPDDKNMFYFFPLQSSSGEDTAGGGDVSFMYDDNWDLADYEVILSEDNGNEGVKKTITFVIAASEEKNISDDIVSKYVYTLIQSYNGKKNSKVVKGKKFRYMLKPSEFSTDDEDELVLYPLNDGKSFDDSEYPTADAKNMKAKLYQGEKVSITGTVIKNTGFDYVAYYDCSAVLVSNSDGTFLLYYEPIEFSGDFKVGKTYKFYGEINDNGNIYDGDMNILGYKRK